MNSLDSRLTRLPHTRTRTAAAFTLLEAIIVIGVLGVLAAVAITSVGNFRESSAKTKLFNDVGTVNTAIKIYLANGGDLAGLSDPQAIVDKLKTRRSVESAVKYSGLRSSMIDKRLQIRMQTPLEALTTEPRAVWNPGKTRFEIQKTGKGVAAFELNAALATVDFGEETRADSAIDYNPEDGWIWAFVETPTSGPAPPTTVPITAGAPLPPDPPGSPERLRPPALSNPGGTFPPASFSLSVAITHTNDPAVSQVFWATQWSGSTGISWQPYTGPVSVAPGQQLLAYVKSIDPGYLDSYSVGGNYLMQSIPLQAPQIAASAPFLDLQTNAPVTLILTNPNPPGAPGQMEIRLPGGAWTPYVVPVSVSPALYASSFTVEARTIATGPGYTDSAVSSLTLPVKLLPPQIQLSAESFSQSAQTITVTLVNSANPVGSSTPNYKVVNLANGSETAWQVYSTPFDLSSANFPKGFTIVALAKAAGPGFLDSVEVSQQAASFFGIGVANTIFVIDTSGSMAWNGRLAQVIAEMTGMLTNYPEDGGFAIVRFSGNATTLVPWTEVTPSAIANAIAQVSTLTPSGATNYSAGLDTALGILQSEDGPDQVVFLSDGAPTGGDQSTAGILSRVDSIAGEGARVDTIGFQINQSGKVLLQKMANQGNGTFVQVP